MTPGVCLVEGKFEALGMPLLVKRLAAALKKLEFPLIAEEIEFPDMTDVEEWLDPNWDKVEFAAEAKELMEDVLGAASPFRETERREFTAIK